jgi:hypothetical protein
MGTDVGRAVEFVLDGTSHQRLRALDDDAITSPSSALRQLTNPNRYPVGCLYADYSTLRDFSGANDGQWRIVEGLRHQGSVAPKQQCARPPLIAGA